jgi:hypothetical protein
MRMRAGPVTGRDLARHGGRGPRNGGALLLRRPGREDAREVVEHAPFREGADAEPQLGAHRPPRRPALVGVVDEHLRELGIGALGQALDRGEARADEHGLEHHLVPGALIKKFRRVGAAVGDRLEHRPDRRAHALGRDGQERGPAREERQSPQIGDALAQVRGPVEVHEAAREA